MADANHLKDLQAMLPHKRTGAVEGGKCLNRHEVGFKQYSCFHKWQAFVRATEDSRYYNWPRYENAAKEQMPGKGHEVLGTRAIKRKARRGEATSPGRGIYLVRMDKPSPGDWDVDWGRHNFKYDCNTPYYHEAHHIIPDSILQTVIQKVLGADGGSPELVLIARNLLLEASYNINHKLNMVLLPMNSHVAKVLNLPIHRQPGHPDHKQYRDYVKSLLQGDFAPMLKDAVDHETQKPGDLKSKLENHSKTIYKQIVDGGYASLDELAEGAW
ncbi:AHH domain-containing protein [Archangium sp.]|uniref:AHH domain-containing protein n=1 Tax=Archangium sp. TaxID=1872627 RepID=UPI002D6BE7F3|nr:AHH domain-containing protein [Archangium sp.]HYO57919.1 AHH domain-containing protein [Archangium sp.]